MGFDTLKMSELEFVNLCKPFRNDHASLVNSHEIICRETRPKETAYIMYSSTSGKLHVIIELEFCNERKFSKVDFNFEDVDFSLLKEIVQ